MDKQLCIVFLHRAIRIQPLSELDMDARNKTLVYADDIIDGSLLILRIEFTRDMGNNETMCQNESEGA